MTFVYTIIAALGVITALKTRISFTSQAASRSEPTTTRPRPWPVSAVGLAGTVLHDGLWTVLAVRAFEYSTGTTAVPMWLKVGIGLTWLTTLAIVALGVSAMRLARRFGVRKLTLDAPVLGSLLFVLGITTCVGIPLFWGVLFVRLLLHLG